MHTKAFDFSSSMVRDIRRGNRSNFIGPMFLVGLPLFAIMPTPNPATGSSSEWDFFHGSSGCYKSNAAFCPSRISVVFSGFGRWVFKDFRRRIQAPAAHVPHPDWLFDEFGIQLQSVFYDGGWKVPAGLESSEAYLGESHIDYPTPPFEAIDWMNGHLPSASKVLYVGEARSFYSQLPVVVSSAFDPQFLIEACKKSRSGSEVAEVLRHENISHVF